MGRNDMARTIHRLNTLTVSRASERGYYPDGAGLYLQVSATGTKSWLFRYASGGRTHDMGLGSLADFSLAEARERARRARQQRADGVDPFISKGYNASAASTQWQFAVNTSTNTVEFISYNDGLGAPGVTSTATSTLNTWEFWVATWDGTSTWKIYKNAGTPASATATYGPAANVMSLEIGSVDSNGTPSLFFPGRIDDARIYNRALTPTDITNIYNSGVVGNP